MANHVIPMVSSSPPPIDDWGESDEFGGFESAPALETSTDPATDADNKQNVNTNSGLGDITIVNDAHAEESCRGVADLCVKVNGVCADASETDPSDPISGGDGAGLKSAETAEGDPPCSGLSVDEDNLSLTAISREDSASSSLAGEMKRMCSELILPDITTCGDEDDNEDEGGINMAAGEANDFPDSEKEDWGEFSDSVPEQSSPEEEADKTINDFNETSSGIHSQSSHTEPASVDTITDSVTDSCSNVDSTAPADDKTSAPTVTSLESETESKNVEDDDWFANIQDDVDVEPVISRDDKDRDNEKVVCDNDNELSGVDRGVHSPSPSGDSTEMDNDHVEVKPDSGVVDSVPADDGDDDSDWDPFSEDVSGVAPVATDAGWAAFGDGNAHAPAHDADAGDWAAFGDSGFARSFGDFDSANSEHSKKENETDTADTNKADESSHTEVKSSETARDNNEINKECSNSNENNFASGDDKLSNANEDEFGSCRDPPADVAGDDDFGNFGGADDDDDDFGDFGGAGDEDEDDFGDFGGGNDDDFGDFEEPPVATTEQQPVIADEQPSLQTFDLAKLQLVMDKCFPEEPDDEDTEVEFPENSLSDELDKEMMEKVEKTVTGPGGYKKTVTETVDQNIWTRLKNIDNTPALKFSWSESVIFNQLLSSLNIDPRNILNAKKPAVPVFAANLGLLEPSRSTDPKPDPATVTSTPAPPVDSAPVESTTDVNIPPVEFDWSSAGLTNPLDSSNSGSTLDLDFFINTDHKPAVPAKSSALENEFLSSIDVPATKKKALTLDSILGNAKLTIVKRDKNENISAEASKVLDKLPNLSFMKAKVLMFPIRSSEPVD